MTTHDLRTAYLQYFKEQQHAIIPSGGLLPINDPTTLFTGSGMQPMLPYLLGERHPLGVRITDSQKCVRAQDIEEVGDNRHTTFFEMLGNWSLGDYFKQEQITWMYTFLTERIGLDPHRLYITVFAGNDTIGIPRDSESVQLWQQCFARNGMTAEAVENAEKNGMGNGRIFYYGEKKNWWSRAGEPANMPVGEPGGPDSEMFWDFGAERQLHENSIYKNEPCHVNCDCGRFMEIGNNVFMEYIRTDTGFEKLKQQNVDYGGGLERIAAALRDDPDVFTIDLFDGMRTVIQTLSGKTYGQHPEETKAFRVVLDHLRAATFMIEGGAIPDNRDAGYFTRRMLRRAIRFANNLGLQQHFCAQVGQEVIRSYATAYPDLVTSSERILAALDAEETQFRKTLVAGEREIHKHLAQKGDMTGGEAFYYYETYGFPLELTEELLTEAGKKLLHPEEFATSLAAHQDRSRTAAKGKFAGGLADHSEATTALHTAAHLMLSALRQVLGTHVEQRGSNITAERLRFDFSHDDRLTDEQKAEVERLVNEAIDADAPVSCHEVSVADAKSMGATGVFDTKYEHMEKIKVYQMGDYSKEICGGPHVEHTGALASFGRFRIQKEESSSSGVRRIKAVLEK